MGAFSTTFAARQFGAWTFIATSAVVGRQFGPAARGAIEGLAVLRLGLHAVAAAGIPAAATYVVARGSRSLAAVAGPATAASLRLGVVAGLAIAVAAFLAPHVFAPLSPAWVALFAACAPTVIAGQALAGALLGDGRTNAWNGVSVVNRATLLASLAAVFLPGLHHLETVVVGMATAEVASFVVAARCVGPAWRPRRDPTLVAQARGYVRAAFLHGALTFAFVRSDALVLSALAGTAATGLFASASLAREMLLFVPWIAGMLHVPKVAAATVASTTASAADPARRAGRPMGPVSTIVTLAVAALLFTFPTGFVTWVHGGRFADAGPLVRILVPTALVAGGANLLLAELLGRGAPRATWLAPGLALAISLAGNVLFVPAYGATATAWTALGASLVLLLVAGLGVREARRRAAAATAGP